MTPDGKWNGQMEITDFGIASYGSGIGKKAGTSGWAEGINFSVGSVSE